MLRDSFYGAVSLLAPAATQFVLRVVVGRTLGDTALGLFTITVAVYFFALLVGGVGVNAALTRFVAHNTAAGHPTAALLRHGLRLSLLAAMVAGGTLYAGADIVSLRILDMAELVPMLRWVAIGLPGVVAGKAVLGYLNGLRRMRTYAAISLAQSLMALAVCGVLIQTGHGVESVAAGFVLSMGAMGACAVGVVFRELRGYEKGAGTTGTADLLHFGLFVTLTNGVGLVQSYTDSLMLGYFLAAREVGLYAVAILALQVVLLPGSAVQLATTPRIAGLWAERDRAAIKSLLETTMRVTGLVVLPVAFTAVVGREFIITLFMGAEFIHAARPLVLLMPGAVAITLWASVGAALSSTGHVKLAFGLSAASAAANVLLNAALIPSYGLAGAAMATSTSLLVGSVAACFLAQRVIGVSLDLRRLVLVALGTATGAVILNGLGLAPASILGAVAYLAAAFAICAATLLTVGERSWACKVLRSLRRTT
ncbi:MAG: flippase [Dehalococcoidia bacterium]|nr:flippase [Dehalococcoidia bacterium]